MFCIVGVYVVVVKASLFFSLVQLEKLSNGQCQFNAYIAGGRNGLSSIFNPTQCLEIHIFIENIKIPAEEKTISLRNFQG